MEKEMFKTWLQCLSLPVGRLQKNETETWLGPITLLLPLFSHWVVSSSLWLHRLQHARLPCPSPSPRVCSNSCPMSQWCYPTISSFTAPSPLPITWKHAKWYMVIRHTWYLVAEEYLYLRCFCKMYLAWSRLLAESKYGILGGLKNVI